MIQDVSDPLAGVTWSNDLCSGEMADHGAHVISWQPAAQAPVIWLSEHAQFASGTAIRGGIPVCFPWFGAGRHGDQSPAHGFARTHEWRRLEAVESSDGVRVVHELDAQVASAPSFSGPFRAVLTVHAGTSLSVALTVENTGGSSFTFEQALHTYLAVGDVRDVEVLGLDGAAFQDKVRDVEAVQEGAISVVGEVDRVYDSAESVSIVDPLLGRTITVGKSGSSSTIVWNPWVDKSRALPDFGDDEWQHMICIETANVGARAITLAPGESHDMTATITVS